MIDIKTISSFLVSRDVKITHHIHPVDGTQLEALVLGVQDDVDHGADLGGEDVLGGVQEDALLQVALERAVRPVGNTFN